MKKLTKYYQNFSKFIVISLLWSRQVYAQDAATKVDEVFSNLAGEICNVAGAMNHAGLIGAALTIIVIIFGWNKIMGEGNAFTGLKNGIVGGIIVMVGGAFAGTLLGNACP